MRRIPAILQEVFLFKPYARFVVAAASRLESLAQSRQFQMYTLIRFRTKVYTVETNP